MTAFELAVQDADGVRVAAELGPDRIELCAALGTGGLTPSAGLIDRAIATGLAVHVLVRPRTGDFAYDPDDQDLIVADAVQAVARGAAGVVVGGTTAPGTLDLTLLARVQDAIGDAALTCHRAFDVVRDQDAALDALMAQGVTRVLTSGGQSRAVDATDRLRTLVERAEGRIEIMAGAGIRRDTVRAVLQTGVDGIHASATRVVCTHVPVSMGADAAAGSVVRTTTDADEARALMRLVRAH